MNPEALSILDRVLPQHSLNTLQETIFCHVWDGKTYAEIAQICDYDHSYVRDVGFRLWHLLSDTLGQKISKSNVRSVLSRQARRQAIAPKNSPPAPLQLPPQLWPNTTLAYPNGPVPLHSKFYIQRPPLEARAYAEITRPGGFVRIRAPRQMGKTSLLRRIVHQAQIENMATVSINFCRADRLVFSSFERFLRWICANISRQLNLTCELDHYWDAELGCKVSCSSYFENCLLARLEQPLLIALDDVNVLFNYPEIASEFLLLLRSWYEDACELPTWQKLRWVIAHSHDLYLPMPTGQLPLNLGISLSLTDFTPTQVQTLSLLHGLDWAENPACLKPLFNLLGGHPSLTRLALYHLAQGTVTHDQLIQKATFPTGIYSQHLRQCLATIALDEDLKVNLQRIMTSDRPAEVDLIVACQLESLGLVRLNADGVVPRCDLYRRYFGEQGFVRAA
ncbi:MAG: AAA-like domain-containing protein [Cyanobacteria bacterium P01_A01_bin.123]